MKVEELESLGHELEIANFKNLPEAVKRTPSGATAGQLYQCKNCNTIFMKHADDLYPIPFSSRACAWFLTYTCSDLIIQDVIE